MAKRSEPRPRQSHSQVVQTLKKENNQLRREVAQLNKELQRLQGLDTSVEDEVPEEVPQRSNCPLCGSSDLAEFTTPSGRSITSCRTCKKWRKP